MRIVLFASNFYLLLLFVSLGSLSLLCSAVAVLHAAGWIFSVVVVRGAWLRGCCCCALRSLSLSHFFFCSFFICVGGCYRTLLRYSSTAGYLRYSVWYFMMMMMLIARARRSARSRAASAERQRSSTTHVGGRFPGSSAERVIPTNTNHQSFYRVLILRQILRLILLNQSMAAMFQRSAKVPLPDRSMGVLHRDDDKIQQGYTLMHVNKESYLLDCDGRVVHEWVSERDIFCGKIRENGNLVRDGSDTQFVPAYRTGGAAGYVEEVTWAGERVWRHTFRPADVYLTHHDIELLPNGNILVLCWEKKSKEQALQAGRRPELIPSGEVWNNLVCELEPDATTGTAKVVWQWSLWDHLVQEYDPQKDNFGCVRESPHCYDINYCPPGGKAASRNTELLKPSVMATHIASPTMGDNLTGERDWVHCNGLSYDPVRDQIALSFNTESEVVIIDHSTSMEESRGTKGGKSGKGGQILYRWGNDQAYQMGDRTDQKLYCQHCITFIRGGLPGEGHMLVFNNGRVPDRHWSSVDEFILPETEPNSGIYIRDVDTGKPFGPEGFCWSFGPREHRLGSFYCTHISGVQRLRNGNTLITMGPQGTVLEITPDGEEVWRYVSPAISTEGVVSFVRQGAHRPMGSRTSLFRAIRYEIGFSAFEGKELVPYRYLEA